MFGTSRRGTRRSIRWSAAILTGVLLVTGLGQAVFADDPPDTTAIDIVQNVAFDGTQQSVTVTVDNETGQLLETSDSLANGLQLAPNCIPLSNGNTLCTGTSASTIQIGGGSTAADARTAAALNWIIKEGAIAFSATNDIANDGKIGTYAAGELRAYIVARITDIFDKFAFGETLTVDEQTTFDYVQDYVLKDNEKLTRYALEEYQLWKAQACLYSPPAAPSFVTSPVHMTEEVVTWCTRAHSHLDTLLTFAPPMPSADHFQTWATYRHADDLGLTALNSPAFQANLAATVGGYGLLAGTAGALALGGITAGLVAGLVGYVPAITLYVASVMGAIEISEVAVPLAVQLGSFVTDALPSLAATAAGVIGIVIFFLALIATAIWQFADTFTTGNTLVDRHNSAVSAKDPFGLAALRTQNTAAGISLADGRHNYSLLDPSQLPAYRQTGTTRRLEELVTLWTTFRNGVVLPDTFGVWDDNATTAADYHFRITTGGLTTDVDEISVPVGDGRTATVRFNQRWMIITGHQADGTVVDTFASLKFDYIDHNGVRQLASRAPAGGWVILGPSETGENVGTNSPIIAYNHPVTGLQTTVQIIPPVRPTSLSSILPTAAGLLMPGRVINLRPNPVNENGTFSLIAFIDDYDYEWTAARFYPTIGDAGDWVPISGLEPREQGGNPNYGARFIPTVPGQYQATVKMTNREDPLLVRTGTVEFTVLAPEIQVVQLALADNPVTDDLRLTLELSENVPSDFFHVTVDWPGQVGSDDPRPRDSLDLACHDTGELICFSVVQQGDNISHTLNPNSDVRQDVVVTVTNSHGNTITRNVPLDHAARPKFVAPSTEPAPEQPGVVDFDPYTSHMQLPINVPDVDTSYYVAGIQPGGALDPVNGGFMLTDPATGLPAAFNSFVPVTGVIVAIVNKAVSGDDPEWVVVVSGTPGLHQLGSYKIPIHIRQTLGGQATMMLQLDVVAAPTDLFRGGLLSEIDPLNFTVPKLPTIVPIALGGRPEWGTYDGQLCVSITTGPPPTPELCADADSFFGPDDAALPFPYRQLAPHGISAGPHEVRAWIPEGERNYPVPVAISFLILSGPPEINELSWNNAAGALELDLAPVAGKPIASISCSVDGGAFVPCFDFAAGAWSETWNPGSLAIGDHTVDMLVTDAADNYDTSSLAFTVSAPPPAAKVATAAVLTSSKSVFKTGSLNDPTFTVTVTPAATSAGVAPTGNVTFYRNNARIGPAGGVPLTPIADDPQLRSVAQLAYVPPTWPGFVKGTYNIKAIFAGDTKYLADTTPVVKITVTKSNTSTKLVVSRLPSASSTTHLRLTATVTPKNIAAGVAPTGLVRFFVKGKRVGPAAGVKLVPIPGDSQLRSIAVLDYTPTGWLPKPKKAFKIKAKHRVEPLFKKSSQTIKIKIAAVPG